MASFWKMTDDGAPATWMDNVDDQKTQPGDAADATRPDIWFYEGAQWRTSGLSPNNAAGIDITTSYAPDWGFVAAVFNDIGDGPVSGGSVPGQLWDASEFGVRVRYYIDASVKSEASQLFPFQVLSTNTRSTISFLATAVYLEFYDFDGTQAFLETLDGTLSDPILWADIIDKLVEFTAYVTAASAGGTDAELTVTMRTSDDGVTWTDHGTILSETGGTDWWDHRISGVPYGMSLALGHAGLPGQCQYAELFRGTPDGTTIELPAIDDTDPCCETPSVGDGAGVLPPDDDVEIIPTFLQEFDLTGDIPIDATPSGGEVWS